MNREELQQDFHNEQGINWLNSQEEPDIDYVMWLEDKIIAAQKSLPPAEGATAEAGHTICVKCVFKVNYDKFDKARVAYEKLTAQRQQQPTAEGAEEYYCRKWGVAYSEIERLKKLKNIQFSFESIMQMLNDFATLHAQRLADKMVSERLREELIAYDRWMCKVKWGMGKIWSFEKTADEYLKTRDSHE